MCKETFQRKSGDPLHIPGKDGKKCTVFEVQKRDRKNERLEKELVLLRRLFVEDPTYRNVNDEKACFFCDGDMEFSQKHEAGCAWAAVKSAKNLLVKSSPQLPSGD